MKPSRQTALLSRLVENIPTIVFFGSLYATGDIRIAGWLAWPVALAVCTAYILRKLKPNTIMLGINLYMIAAVIVGEGFLLIGQTGAALFVAENALSLVLDAVFIVGCVLTIFAKEGFVGVSFETRRATRLHSALLLAISLSAAIWAHFVDAERLIEVGIPLLILFGTQQFLIAKALDSKTDVSGGHWMLAGAVAANETQGDLLATAEII